MKTHAILALLALAACGEEAGSRTDSTVPDPRPLAGTYHLVNRFDVPAASVAPGAAGDAFALLDGLANKPATTLLDLADEAGVPAVGIITAALPDAVESRLDEWMKDYLTATQVGGTSAYSELVKVNGLVQSILVSFVLQSDLALPSSADQTGTHSPTALVFFASTSPVTVQVPLAEVTAAHGVRATASWPSSAEAAAGNSDVSFGDHAMGLRLGQYALAALDIALERGLGASDLSAALAKLVDCPAMAASVANRCVGPVCVGHASELSDVCAAGLRRAASEIEAQVVALDYKAIHFQSGRAKASGCFAGDGATASAGRLSDGAWTVTVDVGNGEKPAAASFEGTAAGSVL